MMGGGVLVVGGGWWGLCGEPPMPQLKVTCVDLLDLQKLPLSKYRIPDLLGLLIPLVDISRPIIPLVHLLGMHTDIAAIARVFVLASKTHGVSRPALTHKTHAVA